MGNTPFYSFIFIVSHFSLIIKSANLAAIATKEQHKLLLRTADNLEVYDTGNQDGESWLQMVLVFSRGPAGATKGVQVKAGEFENESAVNCPHVISVQSNTKALCKCDPETTSTSKTTLKPTSPTTTIKTPTKCKQHFILLGNNCYYFSNANPKSWQNASETCQDLGAHLAYPMNSEEDELLRNHIIANFKTGGHFWLGGSDLNKEGEWIWAATGTKINYTNWSPHQPDNHLGNQHCIIYWRNDNFKWDDNVCTRKQEIICQQTLGSEKALQEGKIV